MKKQIDHLIIKNAKTIGDYLFLRQLRNEVRLNMTGSTNLISLIDQIQFYFLKPANTSIYIAFLKNRRVGYLLIRHTNNTYWITEAVLSKYRHLGIATALINFAKEQYSPLRAEILKSNQASINLHTKCGFALHASYENLVIYSHKDLSRISKLP
jgi:ribosomal protein S18 acetylase RimI-like enzyme